MRFTSTSLPEKGVRRIDGYLIEDGEVPLDYEWIGCTRFTLVKPIPPYRQYLVEGRLTRQQKTSRPDNCWPELWQNLTLKEKTEAQDEWKIMGPQREEHRKRRRLSVVSDADEKQYIRVLAHAIAFHSPSTAPAMATQTFLLSLLETEVNPELLEGKSPAQRIG